MLTGTVILVMAMMLSVTSGCSNAGQTIATVPIAVESSTVETTLIEIQETESVEEEKIPANFELLYVPKIMPSLEAGTILWFNTIKLGLEKCAADYGFKVTVTGPPKFDGAIQAQIVLDNAGKNFDAIIVNPIDEKVMDSALERAQKGGVMTFSNEGYGLKNILFDVEAMSGKDFGEKIMQAGLAYSGGQGKYIISVGFLGSAAQKEWADAEIAYQKKNAAPMINVSGGTESLDRFEDNEDVKTATEKLTAFFENNNEITLVVGNSSTTTLAAGDLIAKKKLKEKVTYVGVGLPIVAGSFINDEVIRECFFWDPYLLGYSMGFLSLQSWLGNIPVAGSSVSDPSGLKISGYENLGLLKNSQGADVVYGNGTVSVKKENNSDWYDKFAEYGWPEQ
jgi:ABC-type sugar transport system substrate-binding protein